MSNALQFVVLTAAVWLDRRQQEVIGYLLAENRVLREKVGKRPIRFTNAQRRRLAIRGRRLGRETLERLASIASPATVLRWYRKLIAAKYDGSSRRRHGRPRTPNEIARLVLTMAKDNPSWGYNRICGALANLGHPIARNTARRILKEHGIERAPERGKRTKGSTFLQAHWEGLADSGATSCSSRSS